jgi:bifunctional non-homologous end joining protein LigD
VPTDHQLIEAGGREVRISSPDKLIFPEAGITKRGLIDYYLQLAEPVLNQLRDRPTVLKRFPNGAGADPFFQKRIPDSAPDWLQTTTVTFPSGRTARELTPNDAAHLVWGVNLGVIDWNPWQVRAPQLDHPDELRVDLDPTPEATWDDVRQVALVCGSVLSDHGLTGYPKTSGSRGIHVYARVTPEHDFFQTRRAALALAREVERRVPELATSKWWKEERHGVFVDYNQNIRDRTVASAYCGWTRSPSSWLPAVTRRPTWTSTSARSTRCSSSAGSTRTTAGSATLRGRRTSANRPASRSGCSPAGPARMANTNRCRSARRRTARTG